MAKGRYYRRLRRFSSAFTSHRRLLSGVSIIAIFIWIADQLAGDAVVNFIKNNFPHYILDTIFSWIANHPSHTAVIFCFAVLAYVFIAMYIETRPPKGIIVIKGEVAGEGVVYFCNKTGVDLNDCNLHLFNSDQ